MRQTPTARVEIRQSRAFSQVASLDTFQARAWASYQLCITIRNWKVIRISSLHLQNPYWSEGHPWRAWRLDLSHDHANYIANYITPRTFRRPLVSCTLKLMIGPAMHSILATHPCSWLLLMPHSFCISLMTPEIACVLRTSAKNPCTF